jgi:hypothetical protein
MIPIAKVTAEQTQGISQKVSSDASSTWHVAA